MGLRDAEFTGIPGSGSIVPKKVDAPNPLGQPEDTNTNGVSTKATSSSNITTDESEILRVQLRPKPGKDEQIYGPREYNTLMRPLYESNGVIFPYTPTITTQFGVEYGQYSPVHSIMDYYSYQRTPAPQFSILGTFTAQNKKEAAYALAVIHFFRTVTKMYFGQNEFEGSNIPIGLAPPVLLLNGYGSYMFNNLPVIITNYTVELLNNVDYVKVKIGGPQAAANTVGLSKAERQLREDNIYFSKDAAKNKETRTILDADLAVKQKAASSAQQGGVAYIPSMFSISATLVVQHTPKQTRDFNIESFRRGTMLQNRKWPNSKGGWW